MEVGTLIRLSNISAAVMLARAQEYQELSLTIFGKFSNLEKWIPTGEYNKDRSTYGAQLRPIGFMSNMSDVLSHDRGEYAKNI